jgi:putative transposase
MLGKENGNNGRRFSHGTPDQLKRIRELEKENKLLKDCYQKELEGKLKTIVKKEISLGEKKRCESYIFKA